MIEEARGYIAAIQEALEDIEDAIAAGRGEVAASEFDDIYYYLTELRGLIEGGRSC